MFGWRHSYLDSFQAVAVAPFRVEGKACVGDRAYGDLKSKPPEVREGVSASPRGRQHGCARLAERGCAAGGARKPFRNRDRRSRPERLSRNLQLRSAECTECEGILTSRLCRHSPRTALLRLVVVQQAEARTASLSAYVIFTTS